MVVHRTLEDVDQEQVRVWPLPQQSYQPSAVLAPQRCFRDAPHQSGEKTGSSAQILDALTETPPRMLAVVVAHTGKGRSLVLQVEAVQPPEILFRLVQILEHLHIAIPQSLPAHPQRDDARSVFRHV